MSRLDDLLRPIPEELRDKPFKMLGEGPDVVAELLGTARPNRSRLHRWEKDGRSGVRLKPVYVPGDGRHTTRRWLCEFFVAVDAARREVEETPAPKKRTKRRYPRKGTARSETDRAARDDNSATTKAKESTHA